MYIKYMKCMIINFGIRTVFNNTVLILYFLLFNCYEYNIDYKLCIELQYI